MSMYLMAPTFKGVITVEATLSLVIWLQRWMRWRLLRWWTVLWRWGHSGCGGVRGDLQCFSDGYGKGSEGREKIAGKYLVAATESTCNAIMEAESTTTI
ncbi:hypothetical protein HN51_059369 [Arachis hypogaea]